MKHATIPCAECPWRRDVPTGKFPPERYVALATTAYDMAGAVFACHMSKDGREFACAGFILQSSAHHFACRMARMPFDDVGRHIHYLKPTENWLSLTASRSMIRRLIDAVKTALRNMEEDMKDDVKQKTYRLVEMQASNFLILKAVTIKPDRSVFRISGQNGAGKSSVLSIISAAIGGAALCPKQAIRKGQTEGMVSADFGALKATRKFYLRADGTETSDLTVEYADGKRPRKPQEILNELRGSPIADDPLEFSRLKPKARYDLLKKLVPDFDFDAQAKIRQELFDDRTQVGRDFDRAKAAAESIDVPVGAAATLVDVTELAAELRAAGEHNSKIDNRAQRREEVAEKIEALRDEADRLMAEAKAKEAEAFGAGGKAARRRAAAGQNRYGRYRAEDRGR